VLDRLAAKPGIVAAGITSALPATGFTGMAAYTIEGRPTEGWKLKFAAFSPIDGDYFSALGIRLLDGRTFTPEDRSDAPLVVIVNQSMARDCWPGQRPVGKRMHLGNPHKGLPWATVVGVVSDTKGGSPDQPSGEQLFIPVQQPALLFGTDFSGTLTHPAGGFITVRSALPPEQMTATLLSTVATVDPLLALQHVQPMDRVISDIEAPRRFNTSLITIFALGALLLAITGIYAVVAFSVSLRNQEIAIRMALGAQRVGIARLVLLSALKTALLGCGLGVLASLSLSRFVGSFLFDVSATDPTIYFASVLIMMLMALLASALPALRAASTDPIGALRST
jgi:putative ABC transport system permease protein